jgi:predicted nuclease of predicted toxin-antitoxin system
MPDDAIFHKAVDEERVILTFDLDFSEIIALSGGREISVVVPTNTTCCVSSAGYCIGHRFAPCTSSVEPGKKSRHSCRSAWFV